MEKFLCIFIVEYGIIKTEKIYYELLDNPHSQSCREMQPVHMGIGKEAIIRILGKAPLQFLHTLLRVEAGRTEGIAEDIGEKEIDGNAFRLGAATGTEYADDLKI